MLLVLSSMDFDLLAERLLDLNDRFEYWFDEERAWLSAKHSPLENVFIFFEEHGFHPFLPVVLLALLLFFSLFLLFAPPLTSSLELVVFDASNNKPIETATVRVFVLNQLVAASVFKEIILFENLPAARVLVQVDSRGFNEYSKEVDLSKTQYLAVRLSPIQAVNATKPLFELMPVPSSSSALIPPYVDYSLFVNNNSEEIEKEQILSEIFSLSESKKIFEIEFTLLDFSKTQVMIKTRVLNQSSTNTFFLSQGQTELVGEVAFTASNIDFNNSNATFVFIKNPPDEFSAKILTPVEESVLTSTFAYINGTAFSPKGIKKIQVSVDGGKEWFDAVGTRDFSFTWSLPASGYYSLSARVMDLTNSVSKPSPTVKVFVSPCKELYVRGETQNKIDLVFLPSQYTEVIGFIDDIDLQLNSLFSRQPFASSQAARDKFNIYYYSYSVLCDLNQETRLWSCTMPANVYASCPFSDYSYVLVNSSLYGGTGANPAISSAAFPDLFPHELGHQVFDLSDRYCCDGGYWESNEFPNLFKEKQFCSTFVEKNYGGQCHEIGVGGWSEHLNQSIMQKIKYDYDAADIARINYVLEKYG